MKGKRNARRNISALRGLLTTTVLLGGWAQLTAAAQEIELPRIEYVQPGDRDSPAAGLQGNIPLGGGIVLQGSYDWLLLPDMLDARTFGSLDMSMGDAARASLSLVAHEPAGPGSLASFTFSSVQRTRKDSHDRIEEALARWAAGAVPLADHVYVGRRLHRQYGVRLNYRQMLRGAATFESFVFVERVSGRSMLSEPSAGVGAQFNLAF